MKKILLFILLLLFFIIVFCVIYLFSGKYRSEIKESVTNMNGVSIFKDKHTREKVEIQVKNRFGENLKNIHIGYIDGKEFEFFQFEDPLGTYKPAIEIYPHHSTHNVIMSLQDDELIINNYGEEDKEISKALEDFSTWIISNSKISDHGMITLEEFSNKTNTKTMIAFFIPKIGSKLKIIGTTKNIVDAIDPDGSCYVLKNKYHFYSFLPFDGITSPVYLIKEVMDNTLENTSSEIGEYIELNNDLSELYFPLQVGNHWKYELKKYEYSAELPDDIDNLIRSSNVEIYIDRTEIIGQKECLVMKEESDEKYFSNECGIVSILDYTDYENSGDDILLIFEKTRKANGIEVRLPYVYLTTFTNSGSIETVNVPLGKFTKALKIESRFSNNEIDVVLTEWLVENIGVIKGKLETEYKNGVPITAIDEWELVSYEIKSEENTVIDNLQASKIATNIEHHESSIAVLIRNQLIGEGSGKIISFATQKIAENIMLKGTEKATEEAAKKMTAKLVGKVAGLSGGFIIGFLLDVPGVGSEAKVSINMNPSPNIIGNVILEKNRHLNMGIELFPGDRAGSLVIQVIKGDIGKTQIILNELQYHCLNESDATYRFEDINIQFLEDDIYVIKVLFPETELRYQFRIICKNFITAQDKAKGNSNYYDKVTNLSNNDKNGFVSDIDGNTYRTVKIGDQWWMAENLKTTKYNDGNDIPLVSEISIWPTLSTPAYCWYNNDENNKNPYGALYNGYAVNTTKLCPSDWHVSSDDEWKTFTDYLGGTSVAGGKLKKAGTSHWNSPNTGATNEIGFTALPGGSRHNADGNFHTDFGKNGYWWSSTKYSSTMIWYRSMYYMDSKVSRANDHIKTGFSIRCVKD